MIQIDAAFTSGFILKILFRYTWENQRYFADYYAKCDRSLVYKWANDSVNLPKKHIATLVRFAIEQTGDFAQIQIRNDIQQALSFSHLSDERRNALLKAETFETFFNTALLQAILLRTEQGKEAAPETGLQLEFPERRPLGVIAICGFFALITGGILWSGLNRAMGWQYFMGGSGNEPAGLISFIWGMLANTPIIVFALISAGKAANRSVNAKIILTASYALLSGFGAFAFYNSGLRAFVEQLSLSYGLREGIIAGLYGLAIASFPTLALFLMPRGTNIPPIPRAVGIILPLLPAAAALTAFGTWMVNRPEHEISQLRGFAVAVVIRLLMFLVAYGFISDRPQQDGRSRFRMGFLGV